MAKFGERTFEKKLVGIVSYKSGERRVKFTLTEEGKVFNGGSKDLTLNIEDLPKPKVKPNDTGKIRVRMSADGTEVEALTPVTGVFNMRLVDLGPRPDGEDSQPMPRLRTWNEGTPKENSYLEFFGVYEITEGKFKGVKLPAYNMHYKFEEDLPKNPGFTRFAGSFNSTRATRLFQLRDWGNLHGIWEVTPDGVEGEPIEWDDETILPELLERALENDVPVRGVMKDGYIKELLPLDEEEDVEPFGGDEPDLDNVDEILEEEVKPKKSAPAKPAVKKISKKSKPDEDEDL